MEFSASAATRIVGLEGGDDAAFKAPPFYDPEAMSRNRVIVAAYNTSDALPRGKSRVARIHFQTSGNLEPHIELMVAGSMEGRPVQANVSMMEGETP